MLVSPRNRPLSATCARNSPPSPASWKDGEEISITRRGKPVARLLPPETRTRRRKVDWSKSAAAQLSRTAKPLTAEQSAALLDYAKGTY